MSDFGDPTAPRPPTAPPPPPGPFPPRQPPPPPPPPVQFGGPPRSDAVPPPPAPSAIADAGAWPYGAPGTPSPYGPRSAFGQQQYATMRMPRPKVTVGAILMLGGGAVVALGSFVTWFSLDGTDYTGFGSNGTDNVRDGPVFLTFGVMLAAFGIALLSAKRVLAVAIIGIVAAALTALFALADLGNVSDLKKQVDGIRFSIGPGLYLCVVGGLVALAGSIVATATRRR